MQIVYLIVPALTDQASQCRIVSITGPDGQRTQWLQAYRETPERFEEAGIMNSQGKLVCLDNAEHFRDMQLDEPLMAGMVYSFDSKEVK